MMMVDEGQARGYERGGIGGMEDSEGSELKRGRSVGCVGGGKLFVERV